MIVTAFEDGKPSWRYLSTATVTHSLLMALHHALDISLTRRSPFKVSAALAQFCGRFSYQNSNHLIACLF